MLINLKIGPRLALGFALLLLLLCVVAVIGAYETRKIEAEVVELSDNWLPSVEELGNLRAEANGARRTSLRHLLEESAAGKEEQARIHAEIVTKTVPGTLARYEKLVSSPEERALFDLIKSQWADYLEKDRELMQLSSEGESKFEQARKLSAGAAGKAFTDLLQTVEKDVRLNATGAANSAKSASTTYSSIMLTYTATVLVALMAGIALAAVITRSITRPLLRAVEVASAVAIGDLTSEVKVDGRDEAAQLMGALRDMNDSLIRIVGQVRNSSDSIATGSSQIATGNADLSQRTEQQAANLEETAASMEEMNATVRQNADTAQTAAQLAQSASVAAARGGDVMQQVIATMGDISSSSRKIGDIIGVIDGIAFQTNILALNAAVEAARAGEQGRGFAVVAGEVRTLAQRSALAAREIKALIGQSVDNVDNGSRLVGEADETMTDIVSKVRRVADLISEIGAATQEQSTGIGQVNEAVSQLDKVTQQNAALVEQSAAAADSLQQQAATLAEVVNVFKLNKGAAA